MSTKKDGKVVALHLNVGHREPMRPVDRASFVAGEGIEGDRHSTAGEERQGYQVLLIDEETLTSLDLAPGLVRENVTTTGVAVAGLPAGARVALGDHVVVRISKECAPCSRMDEIRPGLREQLEGRRGMLASVERGGAVRVGDEVQVLAEASTP